MDMEIVDFYQPRENIKNLYITNIVQFGCACSSEHIVEESLYSSCSRFGLVYEVQVFLGNKNAQLGESTSAGSMAPVQKEETEKIVEDGKSTAGPTCQCQQTETTHFFYAFVKFFSRLAAKRAKKFLHLTHFVGKEACKVNFARRKKVGEEDKVLLHLSRCRQLANCYLGFNGWSSSSKELLKEISEPRGSSDEWSIGLVYSGEISLTDSGLKAVGVGECEETLRSPNSLMKIQATTRCRKRAVDRSMLNAFSKILFVVFSNGRVYPEVDTTKPDPIDVIHNSEEVGDIVVNDLAVEPEEESDGAENTEPLDITSEADLINVDILQHLDDGS